MPNTARIPRGVFVTGTDTGVGKTVVAALCCLALDGAYFKPFQSGCEQDDDTAAVASLTGLPAERFFPPAARLKAALSPLQAAQAEGLTLSVDHVRLPECPWPLVVEGAGGALVPVAKGQDMARLMRRLGLPVLVVAKSGLGTVNHTLLTIEALRLRGLTIAGVALVGPPNPDNRRDIQELGQTQVLLELDTLPELSPAALAPYAARLDTAALCPGEPSAKTLEHDRAHVWHPFTQAKNALDVIPVASGRGAVLHTTDGREIVDLVSSWWVTPHGHSHPDIAQAVARQAATLEQVIFADFTHAPAAELAARLAGLLPEGLSRVFYSDNGSTAVEVGVKMALQYWRNQGQPERTRLAAFDGGYHGDTVGAMSVGFSCGYYKGFESVVFPVDFLPYPATWMDDQDAAARQEEALAALARYFADHEGQVAAIIIEPLIQGAAGMRMVRPEFLRRLAELARQAGALVIFDEVMTGFGRTGAMFACQKARVSPDIICLAKGLTGGFLPLAATVATQDIYEAFMGDTFDKALAHGHSFTANPLGCAAALASLEVFAKERTLDTIAALESIHIQRLARLRWHPRLTRPRAMGAVGAIEITGTQTGYGAPIGQTIKRYFLERGQYVRPLGNVFYIMAPYCLSQAALHQAYDTLEDALETLYAIN